MSICEGEIIWINLTAINRRRVVGGYGSGNDDDVCEYQNLYTRFSGIKRRRRFNPYISPSSLFITLSIYVRAFVRVPRIVHYLYIKRERDL